MLQNEIKGKQIANYAVRKRAVTLCYFKTTTWRIYAKAIRGKLLDFFVCLVLLTQNAIRDGRETVTSHTARH